MTIVTDDQMATLDGKLIFRKTGNSSCTGCSQFSGSSEGLPCSPGTRKDGTHGIWVKNKSID